MVAALRYFAVVRASGPAWDRSRPMREQAGWPAHAAFMNGLVDEGSIVLGGPLGEGEQRFLLIFDAESEDAIRSNLAADPWPRDMLCVESITPWEIVLGGNE